MTHQANPFATRHVRPGQLAFQFPAGMSVRQVVDGLRRHEWWGQIVGPHGVGKSTLLHGLVPALDAAGRAVSWWTLQGGQRRWPEGLSKATRSWNATTLVVVDGYEQLHCLARWRLQRSCRSTGAGLLITTHHDAGLPTVLTLACPLPLVQQLVAGLLAEAPLSISPDEVSSCYATHQGNVREVFFALYDLYEQRRRRSQKLPGLPA